MDAELFYQKLLNHLREKLKRHPSLQIAGLGIVVVRGLLIV
jgi:hypothetical protein